MEKYEKICVVGKGTFGEVFKAKVKATGEIVAIKMIKQQRKDGKAMGLDVTALREIKLLKELKSPGIVDLKDVFLYKKAIHLVLEFLEHDLEQVIKAREVSVTEADIKGFMLAFLNALATCHDNWVLHRDIKPNNLLITPKGELKLADFGLSRIYGTPTRAYTHQVFAHWYRAPELLFGARYYGSAVDIWGAGCVLAELMLRRPWMPSDGTDLEQLALIFQNLGTPTEQQWPGMKELPGYIEFHKTRAPSLRAIFKDASDSALELLSQMMQFDPTRRISAREALKHRFFTSDPPPTAPENLPQPPARIAEGDPQAAPLAGQKRKAEEPPSPTSPLQTLDRQSKRDS